MLSLSGVPSLHPQQEFEVIKHILLRERYLKRLHAACSHAKERMTPEVVRFLDLLRIATIECVEAIDLWEQAQVDYPRVRPFLWNGVSYFEKMCSDLRQLDNHEFLITWLGFQLADNPMILRPDLLQVMLPVGMRLRARSDNDMMFKHLQRSIEPEIGVLYEVGGIAPPSIAEKQSIAKPPRFVVMRKTLANLWTRAGSRLICFDDGACKQSGRGKDSIALRHGGHQRPNPRSIVTSGEEASVAQTKRRRGS